MSYTSLLTHRLAIVTPAPQGDVTQASGLTDYGQAIVGTPTVRLVWGSVQPRTVKEAVQSDDAGVELGEYTIFLQPQRLSSTASIFDADESGPLAGGRRFQIDGIRPFELGSVPHLEVDCRLVGSTESLSIGS